MDSTIADNLEEDLGRISGVVRVVGVVVRSGTSVAKEEDRWRWCKKNDLLRDSCDFEARSTRPKAKPVAATPTVLAAQSCERKHVSNDRQVTRQKYHDRTKREPISISKREEG